MGQIVPALDLRPKEADVSAHLPANIEAEQALLGCLMYDNSAYERLDDQLRPEHFFEPFHQRLFKSVETAIRKGQLADPILMSEQFERDPAFQELGGPRYLADLVDRSPPPNNAGEYGRAVLNMALRRSLLDIAQDAAKTAIEGDEDQSAHEMIEATESRLFALAETKSSGGVIPFSQALTGAVAMAAKAFQRDGGLSGLSTGLIDLDRKLGGLHPSDLIILAARPSMGKSSLAVNIGYEVARRYRYEVQPDGTHKTTDGGQVLIFSLEMSADQLALRAAASASGISGDKLRKGEIDAVEFGRFRDAAIEISEIPLFIDDTGGLSIAKLAARARRQKRRFGLDLIILDYIQLVDAGLRGGANRVEQVSSITIALKGLAKELDVPVLALSQLSRQVENREDKRPQLSDLRESGSIEQDADMVLFIYREAYYLARTEPRDGTPEHGDWLQQMDEVRNLAEVIIGKQRHGPIGTVKLSFDEDLTQFGNLEHAPDRYGGLYGRNPAGAD